MQTVPLHLTKVMVVAFEIRNTPQEKKMLFNMIVIMLLICEQTVCHQNLTNLSVLRACVCVCV